ncbi:MAG: ribosomal-processing cysteine protease Prp [Clostridia bacterium]|nr:ribosomal-processing cysteine protease Prp [Clostridia bacterium]
MIHVHVFTDQELITGFVAEDHAGFAEEGEDIVCAGVSVLTITAINALEAFEIECEKHVTEGEEPRIELEVKENSDPRKMHDAQVILRTMVIGLADIAQQYPEYVQVMHEEWRQNR